MGRLKAGYNTDKWPELFAVYDEVFKHLIHEPIVLLELGVLEGGSLELWRDYFTAARIIGVDLSPPEIADKSGRIRVYRGAQDDRELLTRIASDEAPLGFDIIIDDASHIGRTSRVSFWHLFRKHLKSGGIYSIEDWGSSYWDAWPDGKNYDWHADSPLNDDWEPPAAGPAIKEEFHSHLYGMIGMIKELIDDIARHEIAKGGPHGRSPISPRIKQIQIRSSIAIVTKH